jgi:hypothetical protein
VTRTRLALSESPGQRRPPAPPHDGSSARACHAPVTRLSRAGHEAVTRRSRGRDRLFTIRRARPSRRPGPPLGPGKAGLRASGQDRPDAGAALQARSEPGRQRPVRRNKQRRYCPGRAGPGRATQTMSSDVASGGDRVSQRGSRRHTPLSPTPPRSYPSTPTPSRSSSAGNCGPGASAGRGGGWGGTAERERGAGEWGQREMEAEQTEADR